MKKIFVIISNGGGGIATFQKYFIENILRQKHKIYFIDKKNNHTLKYFNNNIKNKIKYFKCNPISEPKRVLTFLEYIKNKELSENIIFVFSNPLLLILYFFYLKINFKSKKINLVIHSHILKISISQILINFFSSLISPFIDKVYFVSNYTKNWWFKFFFLYKFSNYEVFYNAVNLPKIKKIKNLSKTIGFVGRLEIEKGIDVFSDLMKHLVKYNFKFEIFGEGSFKSKIYKHKNIKINNWENQKIIYKKIGILLVTSPVENCPFSVLEAKSYGIPTLSISKGGIKEIVSNNKDGIVLKNKNLNKIKKSLFKIKNNIKYFNKNCIIERDKFDEKVSYSKIINKM